MAKQLTDWRAIPTAGTVKAEQDEAARRFRYMYVASGGYHVGWWR